MILFEEQKQILKTNLWLPKGMGGGGVDWSVGIGICTLRYMEWVANSELLYSTENSNQYSVIIYMEKESEKVSMRVYVQLNHFVVQQKLLQHCKSNIFQWNFKKWRTNKFQREILPIL